MPRCIVHFNIVWGAQSLPFQGTGAPAPHCGWGSTQWCAVPLLPPQQLGSGDCFCGPPGISCDRISETYWWLVGGDFTGQKFSPYNKHSQRRCGDFLHRPDSRQLLVISTENGSGKASSCFASVCHLKTEAVPCCQVINASWGKGELKLLMPIQNIPTLLIEKTFSVQMDVQIQSQRQNNPVSTGAIIHIQSCDIYYVSWHL